MTSIFCAFPFLQKLIIITATTSIFMSLHAASYPPLPPPSLAITAASLRSQLSHRNAMGFEFIDLQPPSLPPISTRRAGGGECLLRPRGEGADEEDCVTPKSKPAAALLLPPPPPRKPRPVKRKLASPQEGFFPVPSDLAALFVPVPPPPAARRIRV